MAGLETSFKQQNFKTTESTSAVRILVIDENGNVFHKTKSGGFFANPDAANGAFETEAALNAATPVDEEQVIGKYAHVVSTDGTVKTRYSRIDGEWVKDVNQAQLDDVNQANADALNRANHTGTQSISTVSGLTEALATFLEKTPEITSIKFMSKTDFANLTTKDPKCFYLTPK